MVNEYVIEQDVVEFAQPSFEVLNDLEAQAELAEADFEKARWSQAELVVALLKSGMKQQEVADNWFRSDGSTYSRQHVQWVEKTWKSFCHLGGTERPTWNEAYHSEEVRGKKPHVSNNSGQNEWYTPEHFIVAVREVLGHIDLDPASSAAANEVVGADRFYTEDDDGLAQEWAGTVWMNPPYAAGLVDKFAAKLRESVEAGKVSGAVVLVNNATDTNWFLDLAAVATGFCFPTGRIKFLSPDGKEGAPLQGQVFVYCGDDVPRFGRVFGQFGLVLRKVEEDA